MSVNKRSSIVYHNINTFKQQWQQVYFSVRNVGSILLNVFLAVVYYHCGKSKINVFPDVVLSLYSCLTLSSSTLNYEPYYDEGSANEY